MGLTHRVATENIAYPDPQMLAIFEAVQYGVDILGALDQVCQRALQELF